MNETLKPTEASADDARDNDLKARVELALSQCHVAGYTLDMLRRESSDLHNQIQRSFKELLLGAMRHSILVTEIKMHCLEGSELCSVVVPPRGGSERRPYGIRIQ